MKVVPPLVPPPSRRRSRPSVALGGLAIARPPPTSAGRRRAPPAAAERDTSAQYRVLGPRTFADRDAVARTGAAIDFIEHGVLNITATAAEVKAIRALGFRTELVPAPPVAGPGRRPTTLAFPPADSGFHDYAEMTAEVNSVVSPTTRRSPGRSASAPRTRAATSWR